MDWLSIGILLLIQGMSALMLYIYREKLAFWLSDTMYETIVQRLSQPDNQEALAKNVQNLILEPLKMASIGQLGGLTKGLNYAVKDMAKEGIDLATGITGAGDIAMDVIPRQYRPYMPFILKFLETRGMKGFAGNPGAGQPGQVPNAT